MLDKHKSLLDRYAPLTLGPEPIAEYEVATKYDEVTRRCVFPIELFIYTTSRLFQRWYLRFKFAQIKYSFDFDVVKQT